jgi:starch phosphorylase
MQKPAALPELDRPALDAESIRRSLYNRLIYTIGKDPITATDRDWFYAAAAVVRERMIERWMETMRSYYVEDRKRIYYLSMEFLMGRSMTNAMLNMCAEKEFRDALTALAEMGLRPEKIADMEPDPGLGNGGLGRLAACFLDSMATSSVPGFGYGIRYEYGIFEQTIVDGQQVEHADNWLREGNPWEIPAPRAGRARELLRPRGRTADDAGATYPLGGHPDRGGRALRPARGGLRQRHGEHAAAVVGARSPTSSTWRYFNEGNFRRAVEEKALSEAISRVLYPADHSAEGRELRLKQQYFFCACAIHDMLRRFRQNAQRPGAQAARQGGHPAERHAPVHRHRRADAAPAGPRAPRLGRGLGHHAAHVRVHQPHAHARGPREVARGHVRAAAAAAPRDPLRDQPPHAAPRAPLRARDNASRRACR